MDVNDAYCHDEHYGAVTSYTEVDVCASWGHSSQHSTGSFRTERGPLAKALTFHEFLNSFNSGRSTFIFFPQNNQGGRKERQDTEPAERRTETWTYRERWVERRAVVPSQLPLRPYKPEQQESNKGVESRLGLSFYGTQKYIRALQSRTPAGGCRRTHIKPISVCVVPPARGYLHVK